MLFPLGRCHIVSRFPRLFQQGSCLPVSAGGCALCLAECIFGLLQRIAEITCLFLQIFAVFLQRFILDLCFEEQFQKIPAVQF